MWTKLTLHLEETRLIPLKASVMFIGVVAGVLSLIGPGSLFGNEYFCPPEGDVAF